MARVFALVPAAGLARRMGVAKLSLPLGSQTVLEHVLAALRRVELAAIVVVIGPSSAHLQGLVQPPAEVLRLPADTPDMRATVTAGIAYLEGRFHPAQTDGLLLALGDQPTIKPAVLTAMLVAHQAAADKIHVAATPEKRGHPVLFPWRLLAELPSLPPECGVNELLRRHVAETNWCLVDDEEIHRDLDYPEDYQELRRRPWE